jgi:hypothetical protein
MRGTIAVGLLWLAAAPGLRAQTPLPASGALERFRVEPVLVRYYAARLDATPSQLRLVEAELRETSERYAPLRDRLDREVGALVSLTERTSATDDALLAQLDRVLDAERAIKRLNLLCSARVRRQLTARQVEMLRTLDVPPPPPPPPPHPHQPTPR